MINIDVLLNSKLINKADLAEKLYPDLSRESAKKKFHNKANNNYRGKGFTEEERKKIADIWVEFVSSVLA